MTLVAAADGMLDAVYRAGWQAALADLALTLTAHTVAGGEVDGDVLANAVNAAIDRGKVASPSG